MEMVLRQESRPDWEARRVRGCPVCGKTFLVKFPSEKTKCCSAECFSAWRRRKNVRRRTGFQKPCERCLKPYWTNPSLDKQGKKWCSIECYNADRADAKMAAEENPKRCSVEGCNGAVQARDMCGAHYQKWCKENLHAKRYKFTCPTCNQEFYSASVKRFCSMRCYVSSPQYLEMMKSNRAKAAAASGIEIGKRIEISCRHCGKITAYTPGRAAGKVVRGHRYARRFCGRTCMRLYFSERFDRYMANPETVALPQCYDEFLTREKLPCLIDGCDWVGINLSMHVNMAHGIDKEKFKEMAGFCVTTGVVPAWYSELLATRAQNLSLGNNSIGEDNRYLTADIVRAPRGPVRLEAKEHKAKAMAESGDELVVVRCVDCGCEMELHRKSSMTKRCPICKKLKEVERCLKKSRGRGGTINPLEGSPTGRD